MDEHHEKNDGGMVNGEQPGEAVSEGRNRSGADQRRRRLLQGAAATSAVYTLGTRPVLANGACTSSVLMSGNVSLHPEQAECRLGCSPGYWKNNSDACWEAIEYNLQSITPTTPFTDIFLTGVAMEDIELELKSGLRDVLNLNGNGNGNGASELNPKLRQAAFHSVAAFLNTVHPEVNGSLYPNNNGYPYTPQQIVNDFDAAYQEYLSNNSVVGFEQIVSSYDDYDSRECPLSNHCG